MVYYGVFTAFGIPPTIQPVAHLQVAEIYNNIPRNMEHCGVLWYHVVHIASYCITEIHYI